MKVSVARAFWGLRCGRVNNGQFTDVVGFIRGIMQPHVTCKGDSYGTGFLSSDMARSHWPMQISRADVGCALIGEARVVRDRTFFFFWWYDDKRSGNGGNDLNGGVLCGFRLSGCWVSYVEVMMFIGLRLQIKPTISLWFVLNGLIFSLFFLVVLSKSLYIYIYICM